MVFRLYGMEVLEDPVHLFYANLYLSHDSDELETLVLGMRIILNDFLFQKVFDTKFPGVITFMNDSWPYNFEVSFEEPEKAVSDLEINVSNFGSLSFSFKYRTLAHIIATTLIP